jgi:hypothetical protein
MPVYLVRVTVYTGEYEKVYEKLVEAPDKERAEYDALHGETHNTDSAPSFEEWQSKDTHWQWEDDWMIYTAYAAKELDPNQINAVKGIITIH